MDQYLKENPKRKRSLEDEEQSAPAKKPTLQINMILGLPEKLEQMLEEQATEPSEVQSLIL